MLWRSLAMAMGGCWARQSDAGCVEISGGSSFPSLLSVRLSLGCVRWLAVRHTLSEFSGSVHSFSGAALRHRQYCRERRELGMKGNKDLQFCIDQLRLMRDRNGLQPEQKSALERTEFKLKRLRRNQRPDRQEVFEVVREVAEAIINNFVSRE